MPIIANLILNKNFLPYILIAAIIGYGYYKIKENENLKTEIDSLQVEVQTNKENLKQQKKYFEKKILIKKSEAKFKEKKKTIENKVKKDDKNIKHSNRFILD